MEDYFKHREHANVYQTITNPGVTQEEARAFLNVLDFCLSDLPKGAQPHHSIHKELIGEICINHYFTIRALLENAAGEMK